MRQHLLLFFLGLFFLISCSDDKPTDDVIQKDKMIRLLTDVHIINGSMAAHGVKDSLYKYGTNRYALLFKKYGVDSVQFRKSVQHYAAIPEEMLRIYDQVDTLLKHKNDSLGKVHEKTMLAEQKLLEAKNNAALKTDSARRDSITRSKAAIRLKINRSIQ